MHPDEFRLLLCCARSRPDVGLVKNLASKDINWTVLLNLAAQHCIRPLLFQTLKSVCWDAVPETMQRELVRFVQANAQKNLTFTGELFRLLDTFQQDGIPIAAFKGPVLAVSMYGDLSLREFSDLDVIVPEADVYKAEEILTSSGYQPDFPDREYRSAFVSYQGQYAFRNSTTAISVDLHWRLSRNGVAFPLSAAEMWSKLDQIMIAGRMIPTLTKEELVLFLAAHGTKEGWRHLVWLCDFAELLRSWRDINWASIFERAQRTHCSRPLLLATYLATSLLDAPAPAEVFQKGQNNSAVRALAEKAQLRMHRNDPQGELDEFLNSLTAYDRIGDKLLAIGSLLTTPTVGDFQAMPLPKSLWRIYYLTRPFRLAGKVPKIMVRSLSTEVSGRARCL
jgi:hypothetical protein